MELSNTPKIEMSSLSNNSLILDKLKPSTKNKLIARKYKNLGGSGGLNFTNEDNGKRWSFEQERVNTYASFQKKWDNIVSQAKQEAMQLDLNASEVGNLHKDDISLLSDNLEELNNYIEENYQIVLTENMFLRQENHSIIPFLLLSSKKIHRMCLSDYEIKMMYKMFRKKLKHNRIDGIDYYKIGIIDFYKGKYIKAYNNFKIAYDLRPNEVSIAKWLAFTILVLLFCPDKNRNFKIDFSKIGSVDIEVGELKDDDPSDSFFFGCCSSRKQFKMINSSFESTLSESNLLIYKYALCRELHDLIKIVAIDNTNAIEGLWMYMIISAYVKLKPEQKAFKGTPDPKHCIRVIKERDMYLAYIVYAEYSLMCDANFQVIPVYKELVTKYPNRIDAYLRYWSILTKSKDEDFKLAIQLSETFWRNSSIINFDNNVY
jgi:tetratricopeptide (TPR) repeat protein